MERFRPLEGFNVGRFRWDSDAITGAMTEALVLMNNVDPRRFGRARKSIRRILIAPIRDNAYWVLSGTCILSDEQVDGGSTVGIATVVHEAVHARLDHWANGPELRSRIERRCLLEQIAFVERVPVGLYPRKDEYVAFLRTELSRVAARPRR